MAPGKKRPEGFEYAWIQRVPHVRYFSFVGPGGELARVDSEGSDPTQFLIGDRAYRIEPNPGFWRGGYIFGGSLHDLATGEEIGGFTSRGWIDRVNIVLAPEERFVINWDRKARGQRWVADSSGFELARGVVLPSTPRQRPNFVGFAKLPGEPDSTTVLLATTMWYLAWVAMVAASVPVVW